MQDTATDESMFVIVRLPKDLGTYYREKALLRVCLTPDVGTGEGYLRDIMGQFIVSDLKDFLEIKAHNEVDFERK